MTLYCCQLDLAWENKKANFAKARSLLQFMKNGDPNGGGLPAWPRYTPANGETMMKMRIFWSPGIRIAAGPALQSAAPMRPRRWRGASWADTWRPGTAC